MLTGAWVVAGWSGAAYGVFLTVTAVSSAPGAALTGHGAVQSAVKVSMAVLLAVAATAHPIARERRWCVPALLSSAVGDGLLAVPWWAPSFVAGLSAFLLGHLCYLGALVPLARAAPRPPVRWVAVAATAGACAALLIWFWPRLSRAGLALPVAVYIAVLGTMVSAALLAQLPTRWTAVGAVFFAVSDAMIGVQRFVLDSAVLEVPVWWTYAAAQILITAGLFFGRDAPAASVASVTPPP